MPASLHAAGSPRRQVVLGLLIAACCPDMALGAAGPRRLSFEALRNGRRIGRQLTTLERSGALMIATTQTDFAVKLGPITAYRYSHSATERWEEGAFSGLETQTNQNGKRIRVTASGGAGGVRIVRADGARITAPPGAAPFSHWNRAIAGRPLFNPQDGKLLRVQASPPRPASTLLADGTRIPTTRIAFQGEVEIQNDYDADDVWAGLAGKLEDGSRLEYRRG